MAANFSHIPVYCLALQEKDNPLSCFDHPLSCFYCVGQNELGNRGFLIGRSPFQLAFTPGIQA